MDEQRLLITDETDKVSPPELLESISGAQNANPSLNDQLEVYKL